MSTEKEYTGASFEMARPSPDSEEKSKEEKRNKPVGRKVVTGSDFELSRPAPGLSGPHKTEPAKKNANPRTAGEAAEMSPAQRFFLARPGEGAISAPNDSPRKGGRDI